MKKIVKTHDVWAFVVIPVLVLAMPYVLAWFWPSSKEAREAIYDLRIIVTAFVIGVGILCRIKIYLADYKILFHKKWIEIPFDLLISIPILFSGAITIVCFLPALYFARIVWAIKQKKHTAEEEKQKVIKNYFLCIILFLLWDKWDVSIFWFFAVLLFFMTTIKVAVYFLVAYITPVKEDTLFLEKIIQGLLYMLCGAVLFSIGVAISQHNKPSKILRALIDSYYVNHEGFLGYFLWVIMAGFRPTKYIAGKNLLKYPIFADFIEMVCIFTDRSGGNAVKFWPWLLYKFLQLLLWVSSKIHRKVRKLLWESKAFQWIWLKVVPKQGKNVQSLLEIKATKENDMATVVSPDGRETVSAKGELLRHKNSAGTFLEHSLPVLIIGDMHYRPSRNKRKEPLAKKWYFQFWFSPCRIHMYFLDPIEKKEGPNNNVVFTSENDEALRCKKIELGLLIPQANAA